MVDEAKLRLLFDERVARYNTPDFIATDPIQIPRAFLKKQDREIAGFWTAMLAWGNRTTIINKAGTLFALMGNEPHRFIVEHDEIDRKAFLDFRHRTFQATDTLYFLHFLQWYYRRHESLEEAFCAGMRKGDADIAGGLDHFHEVFFHLPEAPQRTRKHVASPARKSTCKRLNMFLRWMVRRDDAGVDFGIWENIQPSQLMIPLDVHVEKVARRFGMLTRPARDWRAVEELTASFRRWDPDDPARYDFALFGMSAFEDGSLDG
jgi:uncharacterized protein (TIGR02757 family)